MSAIGEAVGRAVAAHRRARRRRRRWWRAGSWSARWAAGSSRRRLPADREHGGPAGRLRLPRDRVTVADVIKAGQKVLATGRNEDSTWLRIHYPSPARAEAWVEAGPLTVDGSVAALPVAECIPELAIAPPVLAPEAN